MIDESMFGPDVRHWTFLVASAQAMKAKAIMEALPRCVGTRITPGTPDGGYTMIWYHAKLGPLAATPKAMVDALAAILAELDGALRSGGVNQFMQPSDLFQGPGEPPADPPAPTAQDVEAGLDIGS